MPKTKAGDTRDGPSGRRCDDSLLLTHRAIDRCQARIAGVVAIYSAESIRDAGLNDAVGKSLAAGPAAWSRLASLRRDPHEPDPSCWLHGKDACFSTHPM